MAEYSFEEFVKNVEKDIKEYLPEQFANSEVAINVVPKNNEVLTGVVIPLEGSPIIPTIYLEPYYRDYETGQSTYEEALQDIARTRVTNMDEPEVDVKAIMQYDSIKDKIAPRLYGLSGNEKLLEIRPYTQMADLAITYSILLTDDKLGNMSIPINHGMMKTWNIPLEQIHEQALANQATLTPSTFKSIAETLKEMMMPQLIHECDGNPLAAEEMFNEQFAMQPQIYVLSNEAKVDGAAAILDATMMEWITEKVGTDFYVLPSSVHELLIVPASTEMELSDLEAMVQEVNATQLQPCDLLSDHVYRYDAETKELYRADQEAEHMKEKTMTAEAKELPKDAVADKKADREDRASERMSLTAKLEDKKIEAHASPKKEASPEKLANHSL